MDRIQAAVQIAAKVAKAVYNSFSAAPADSALAAAANEAGVKCPKCGKTECWSPN
jgi:hypothetical protein